MECVGQEKAIRHMTLFHGMLQSDGIGVKAAGGGGTILPYPQHK